MSRKQLSKPGSNMIGFFGFALASLVCIGLFIVTACQKSEPQLVGPESQLADGQADIRIALSKIGALQKASDIQMQKLFLNLHAPGEASIMDTLELSGGGSQTVSKTYTGLASNFKIWTLEAEARDFADKIIYSGSIDFTVRPRETVIVALKLSALFSNLKANFLPIRDSINRCEIRVDDIPRADSTFAKQSLLGGTVKVSYDYLPAAPTGASHQIRLNAYGDMWGVSTLLYQGDTTISVTSGRDTAYNVVLYWVGSSLPPPGQAAMTVTLGAIGTVTINGNIADTAAIFPKSSLSLWLRADSGIVLDKANVTRWQDQSGNVRDAVSMFGSHPQFVSNVLNGKPVVRLNGLNNGLQTPAFLTFPKKRGTIYVVTKINGPHSSSGVGYGTIFSTYFGSGITWQFGAYPGNFGYYDGVGGSNKSIGASTLGTWNLLVLNRGSDNTLSFYKDGVLTTSHKITNNQPDTNPFKIGTSGGSPGEYYNGDYAEIMIFDKSLASDEMRKVEAYLGSKYGMKFPATVTPKP